MYLTEEYCNVGQKISKLRHFAKYLGKPFSMPGKKHKAFALVLTIISSL